MPVLGTAAVPLKADPAVQMAAFAVVRTVHENVFAFGVSSPGAVSFSYVQSGHVN